MYLAKYISKPESSFDVKLSKNPSDPERYLRTRIIGACEALDIQLGFNQYHMSRNTEFLDTELQPTQRFLKTQAQLKDLSSDSEDIYVHSKFEVYLQRNSKLYDITYPTYFQWWRKCTSPEQHKAKKGETKDGATIRLGYKGTDEFFELKDSITNSKSVVALFSAWLNKLSKDVENEVDMQMAALSAKYQHAGIVKSFNQYLSLRCDEGHGSETANEAVGDAEKATARANTILNEAGLLDRNLIDKANKQHWLYDKLTNHGDEIEDITKSSLYKMLEVYPAGTLLRDNNGNF